MTFETFITYWIAHNEAIIQWILAVIAGASCMLFFRAMFGRSPAVAGAAQSDASIDKIQVMIQKVLDQTVQAERIMANTGAVSALSGAPASAGTPAAGAPADPVEMARLQKILIEREAELNQLKAGGVIDDKLRAQIARVQELESKLKEYEILEDDIADLTLYKEENARLKSELQKFAGDHAAGGDALVAQFAQTVDQAKGAESAAPVPPPAAAPQAAATPATQEAVTTPAVEAAAPAPEGGDPMTDFTSAVEMERANLVTSATPEPAHVAVPEPAPASPLAAVPPAPAAPAGEKGPPAATTNLFAEFSEGSLDTDRVMEEMVSLENLKDEGADALEGSIDADKMVAEASGFSKS